MTVDELRDLLSMQPADAWVGISVDGEPQGRSLFVGEGYNDRESIYWLRASTLGDVI